MTDRGSCSIQIFCVDNLLCYNLDAQIGSVSASSWMSIGGVSRLIGSTTSNETWKYAIPLKTNGFIRLKVSMEE